MGEILEDGDIYFLYRPRVDDEEVESPDEVQRLLIVLHSWPGKRLRLLIAGRKRLPKMADHERSWWFVFKVASRPEELREALDRRTYQTRTRGERVPPRHARQGKGPTSSPAMTITPIWRTSSSCLASWDRSSAS